MDLDTSKPPPFLVHFEHIPGQLAEEHLFTHFRPLGFDWLYYDIWSWLVYHARLVSDDNFDADMPFFSKQQGSFGFSYQLRHANKPYVIVLPQISRVFDQATKQLRDYQLYSAATLRKILLAIQGDILPIHDDTLSHVAISANSSGCNVLAKFLVDNVAAAKRDPKVGTFMNDEFNELFVLDPRGDFADPMIAAMGGAKANPLKRGKHGLAESPDKRVSVAYLPFDARDGNDVWQQTYDEHQPDGDLRVNNLEFVHHAIPALCLTDAAARSLYV
ncbi:hypothetical protein [Amycolatopsis lexingtonensis]|nr:hypothetical protein [Amycolatopsis lexingtonensis]